MHANNWGTWRYEAISGCTRAFSCMRLDIMQTETETETETDRHHRVSDSDGDRDRDTDADRYGVSRISVQRRGTPHLPFATTHA
jgi:hypothetical protein